MPPTLHRDFARTCTLGRNFAWTCTLRLTVVLALSALVLPARGRAQEAAAPADGGNPFGASGQIGLVEHQPSVGSGRSFDVLSWPEIEPAQNVFDWTAMDALVRQIGQAGLEPMFKITTCGLTREGRDFWATPAVPDSAKLPPGPCTSMPPRKPADLSDFVFQVVSRYKDTRHVPKPVRYFAIGNEVNDPNQWPGLSGRRRCVIDESTGAADCPAVADYLTMLKTARAAAHAANPQVVVLESGLGSRVWGLAIARDIYQDGGKTEEALVEATTFYNRYYAGRYRTPLAAGLFHVSPSPQGTLRQRFEARIYTPYDPQGPDPLVNVPVGDRFYYVAKHIFDDPAAFDAIQLHFYDEWSLMNEVVTWIRKQMDAKWGPGNRKPILCWECGSHWPVVDADKDGRGELWNFDADEYSARLVKRFVIGLSRGVGHVAHLPFAWTHALPGTDLFDSAPLVCASGSANEPLLCGGSSDPNVLTPPGRAFLNASRTFEGYSFARRDRTLGPEVEAYRITKPTETVVALWSLAGPRSVDLTILGDVRRIKDQYGIRIRGEDSRAFPLDRRIVYVTLSEL